MNDVETRKPAELMKQLVEEIMLVGVEEIVHAPASKLGWKTVPGFEGVVIPMVVPAGPKVGLSMRVGVGLTLKNVCANG